METVAITDPFSGHSDVRSGSIGALFIGLVLVSQIANIPYTAILIYIYVLFPVSTALTRCYILRQVVISKLLAY